MGSFPFHPKDTLRGPVLNKADGRYLVANVGGQPAGGLGFDMGGCGRPVDAGKV